ncbi:hypothetical protein I79_020133 [Cricetulus griseus]|uniref:Uncharacterized protein n=1 Tax=Cricetulus griseus TaxID=10029 RepID=G3I997_CRIGR|nr:hypothetical protein I79_020133 [Cricetulus griseus]
MLPLVLLPQSLVWWWGQEKDTFAIKLFPPYTCHLQQARMLISLPATTLGKVGPASYLQSTAELTLLTRAQVRQT